MGLMGPPTHCVCAYKVCFKFYLEFLDFYYTSEVRLCPFMLQLQMGQVYESQITDSYGNLSAQRKTCLSITLSTTNPTMHYPGIESGSP